MSGFDEDIFGENSLKLILRYGQHTIDNFDKYSKGQPFAKFLDVLNHQERLCYITRKDETQQKIIIPMPEPQFGGQFEVIVEWDKVRNAYEIKVNRTKKTKYNPILTSIDSQYTIEQQCELIFIDINTPFSDFNALAELYNLEQRVSKLEISPATQVENERELWTKFIDAQQLRIDKLQEPFECSGTVELIPIQNGRGEVSRFKLIVPLQRQELSNKFQELIDEYKDVFGKDIILDARTGIATLTTREIENIDVILQRRFNNKYERKTQIACILKIEPISIWDQLYVDLCNRDTRYFHSIDDENNAIRIYVNNFNVPKIPYEVVNKYSLKAIGVFCRFEKTDEFGKRHIDYITKKTVVSTKSALQRLASDLEKEAKDKRNYWLSQNDYVQVRFNIGCLYSYNFSTEEFTKEFWEDVRRELYGLNYSISESDASISFDFTSKENLEDKVQYLLDMKRFKLKFNPLRDADKFKFKVTYRCSNEIDKTQTFDYKIEKLKNVSFVTVLYNNSTKKKEYLFIGNLNGYESNETQLVFNIPYYFKEDKKAAEKLIKLLKKNDNKFHFDFVNADLRGDAVKIKWLKAAIYKLANDSLTSTKSNSKPVNVNIREFIFDSSKAQPTFRFDLSPITETEEYRTVGRRQLLSLNNSQRAAVVRALYAQDMCLLQGPPGTGKTTVIAELIWQHVIQKSLTRLLVTSETNLAVDNALEKLMNGRNIPKELARYLHIIKPLRFGRSFKFEEEGKRYSVDRIEKWLDDDYEDEFKYENEMSSLESAEDDSMDTSDYAEDVSSNAVFDWMCSIADRADKSDKYKIIIDEFATELKTPIGFTKRYFKDKYFKYANVIGSTCSSTGSPAFAMDFARIYSTKRYEEYIRTGNYQQTITDIKGLINAAKDGDNDFSATAKLIVKRIISENNIKTVDDLDELITNPTENFKHFLFDYELKNLLRAYSINNQKKLDRYKARLCFDSQEEFNQFLTISFDTVIMDEASKATPPDLVLPLCFGNKSIIIGDHRQLPPMLNERDFKESLFELNDPKARALAEELDREFMDTSQFSRLILNRAVSHTIKSVFTEQYRMHPQINDVIKQFYINDDGGLHCGLDIEKVDSPNLAEPQSRFHGFSHPGFISADDHVLWVNVDAPELRAESGALYNDEEVSAVKRVLDYLYHSDGFREYMDFWDENIQDIQKRNFEKEIGIISFYSKQVSELRSVKTYAQKLGIRVKLNTVDKFQGMERNIVIVSTVRSNKKMHGGRVLPNIDSGFAKSPERLNVALSRARRLLIVVGNSDFFGNVKDRNGNYLYRNVINEIQSHREIIDYRSLIKYEGK